MGCFDDAWIERLEVRGTASEVGIFPCYRGVYAAVGGRILYSYEG